MKILIVDDEIKIREVVKEYCKLEGYDCYGVSNGRLALDLLAKYHFECIVLDIMMPELDGFATLKKIKEKYDTPVIMLSARQEEDDKLYSFNHGVDDYVSKPFSPKELMARIRAIIKRQGNNKQKFVYEDLKLDISGRSLKIAHQEIALTPKEMELLIYLVKNSGQALSRQQLLSAIWHYDYNGEDRTVDTHIKMLRHNLGKYRNLILTIRGMGYKFEI